MSFATSEPQQCIARPPSPLYGGPASKDFTERTIKSLKVSLGKLWRRRSVTITEYDPTYKCAYLGNVLTGWAKGEGCVEKPLSTLWKNYTSSSKPDVQMKVTVTQSGLKAVTKEHGLTEYWSHRITYCAAPAAFPRIFCWVYRHEGRKLKQELRCHAVLCSKEAVAKRMAVQLRSKLAQALHEFKRDKICRQNARLSLANSVYDNPSLPRRKILLSTGSHNYRPPLERSKSAPKLMAIEESLEEEEECAESPKKQPHSRFLLRINSVPLAKEEMKHLSPQHISRLFQRVNVIAEVKDPFDKDVFRTNDDEDERRYDEVFTDQETRTEHIFDVKPVREEDLIADNTVGERRYNKSPLVRRNSIKRVAWALDSETEQRRHSTSYNNERLLVLGNDPEESDENSLQSISSSGSCSSTENTSTRGPDNMNRQYSLPLLYQDQRNIPGQNQIIYQELRRGIEESQKYQTDVDEEYFLDNVVDDRPTGGVQQLKGLPNVMKRSVTFPPPSDVIEELDSLSDEEGCKDDEETESDESGYAEIMDKEYKSESVGKDEDGPHHQIIKSILRPTNRNSQCVQV